MPIIYTGEWPMSSSRVSDAIRELLEAEQKKTDPMYEPVAQRVIFLIRDILSETEILTNCGDKAEASIAILSAVALLWAIPFAREMSAYSFGAWCAAHDGTLIDVIKKAQQARRGKGERSHGDKESIFEEKVSFDNAIEVTDEDIFANLEKVFTFIGRIQQHSVH